MKLKRVRSFGTMNSIRPVIIHITGVFSFPFLFLLRVSRISTKEVYLCGHTCVVELFRRVRNDCLVR